MIDANKISDWQSVPAEKAFMFVTTVGDKIMLKIEDDKSRNSPGSRGGRKGFYGNGADSGHKRKFDATNGSNHNGKDSYARVAAGSDRDDHTPRGAGRFAQRNAQSKANFNNRGNNNMSGNRGNNQAANTNGRQRGQASGPGASNRGGRGGGAAGGGGNRGPPAYRSLDAPGNFDGPSDPNTGSGEVVMNY